jgi:hypothetical protein
MTTSDGGKTWNIPTIKVEQSTAPEQFVKGVKWLATGASPFCGK